MSKKDVKNEKAAVAEQPSNLPVKVEVDGQEPLNVAQTLEKLKKADVGDKITASEFHTFEEGEETRAVFLGLTTVNEYKKKDTRKDAVRLLLQDGREVVNADVALVSTLRNLNAPVAIMIVNTGWIEGDKGNYRSFTINRLSI